MFVKKTSGSSTAITTLRDVPAEGNGTTTRIELIRTAGVVHAELWKMEHGKAQIGAEILLRIRREFGKSIEWLLTGEE